MATFGQAAADPMQALEFAAIGDADGSVFQTTDIGEGVALGQTLGRLSLGENITVSVGWNGGGWNQLGWNGENQYNG